MVTRSEHYFSSGQYDSQQLLLDFCFEFQELGEEKLGGKRREMREANLSPVGTKNKKWTEKKRRGQRGSIEAELIEEAAATTDFGHNDDERTKTEKVKEGPQLRRPTATRSR